MTSIPRTEHRLSIELQRRCDVALSVMVREFDPPVDRLPNLVHVGPIFEEDSVQASWDPPWPSDHPHPLVVVSMSSQYMSQEPALARVIAALEGLPLRALVLTGLELGPDEVQAPPHVVVQGYVPHIAVMPQASAVVTHGGMGTIMAAFAFGVPVLCMPLGRDQLVNARRVEALRAGRTIAPDASEEAVRAAILGVLESEELRAGAARMAEIVQGYGSGALAVRELELLLARSLSARPTP
jgi:MGT family glycosyltransferase